MKILRTLALLVTGAIGLVGCGSGGVQSPDFTTELRSLTLSTTATDDSTSADPTQYFIALGVDSDSNQLTAVGLCNTPPGTKDSDADAVGPDGELLASCGSRDAAFRIVASGGGAARVVNGRIVGDAVGMVRVTASEGDVTSNELIFRIGAPIVTDLQISPQNPPPISVNETLTFTATGTFSDGTNTPVEVTWTATDTAGNPLPPGTVTFDTGPGNMTTVTPQPGSQGQSFIIVGTITASDGNGGTITETDSTTVTISNEILTSLLRVQPSNQTVAPNATVTFTAVGRYEGGAAPREGNIPANQVTWNSSNTAVASIGMNSGIATGGTPGDTLITATLVDTSTIPSGGQTSAFTTLTVTTATCTAPLLSVQGATTSSTISGACVGCTVTNAQNVTDGDPNSFGTISLPVSVTGGNAALNVDAAPATANIPAGSRAGFVVAKPAGLLSASILSSLSISTRLDGAPLETAGPGGSVTTPLEITLLGAIGGQDAALLSFVTAQDYDGVAVTFNGGLLSVLANVNVLQACGNSVNGSP